MIKKQILIFVLRWVSSALGMWICIRLFGTIYGYYNAWLFISAGLVFSIVNTVVKPLAKVMALPLIIFTVGLFTFVLNIGMMALTIWIIPDVSMSFWGVLASTLVMSIINSLVNLLVPSYNEEE